MPTIELNDSNGFKIATLTLETQDPITVNNLIIRLRNNTHLINSDSQFFVENQEIFLNSIVNSNQIITVVSNHTILPPVPSVDELKSTISLILSNTNEKLVLTDSIFQVMTNLFMSRLSQICQEKAIDEAINLFKHAKLYQSNLTEKLLSLNISINSLYDSSTESLMFICNDIKTGKPLILKIPRQDNEKPSEFRVLENLGESNLLPKTILLNLSIKDQEDDDDVYCLVMERYVSSLANPLQRYSNELIINRAKSLILAVNYIHSFGYVHVCFFNIDGYQTGEYFSRFKCELVLG